MFTKQTQELLSKIVENWGTVRAKAGKIIGVWWDNPNLIWIYSTENEEEQYEGEQSQMGVAKDGSLRWEFQSHCSCNYYENTTELPEQFTKETLKSFSISETIPPAWEKEICENMTKILNSISNE